MSAIIQTRNRNVDHRLSADRRWDVEFTGEEARFDAVETRKGPGKRDTDEWKANETDQAHSGYSIFDLDAILNETEFELDEPNGKPSMAADNQATTECGFQ